MIVRLTKDKPQLTGQVFNSRRGHFVCHVLMLLLSKTAQLKVENLAKTTFRFSPFKYRTTQPNKYIFVNTFNCLSNISFSNKHSSLLCQEIAHRMKV